MYDDTNGVQGPQRVHRHCVHQYSERFVLPDRFLNGPAHSLSDSACGIALGLCDKAYNAFRACSNDDEILTMRHWIDHVYSDHSENPVVCGCSIDLRIPTVVEE